MKIAGPPSGQPYGGCQPPHRMRAFPHDIEIDAFEIPLRWLNGAPVLRIGVGSLRQAQIFPPPGAGRACG